MLHLQPKAYVAMDKPIRIRDRRLLLARLKGASLRSLVLKIPGLRGRYAAKISPESTQEHQQDSTSTSTSSGRLKSEELIDGRSGGGASSGTVKGDQDLLIHRWLPPRVAAYLSGFLEGPALEVRRLPEERCA
jgi:hypothetical protein